MRLLQSARLAHTDSLEFLEDAGLTRVVLSKEQFGRPYQAGQYCWLNLPAESPLEWHPFTISSAPAMASVEFSVQALGPGEWTGRLAQLARADRDDTREGSDSFGLFQPAKTEVKPGRHQILIDGPYGRAMPLADKSTVLLLGLSPLCVVICVADWWLQRAG
jgi:predicted ferric reductase